MKIKLDNELFFANIKEKYSNLSMFFMKEYIKFDKEYFCMINLNEETKPLKTKAVSIGLTLLNILNNKEILNSSIKKFKQILLNMDSKNEIKILEDFIIDFEQYLQSIDDNFIIFGYLMKCLMIEHKEETFEKIKTSLAVFLNDLSYQIIQLDELVNLLFIQPKENSKNFEELNRIAKTMYYNPVTLPAFNYKYEISKYYPKIVGTEYEILDLMDLTYCTIYHLSLNEKTISKCSCCGKFFIPYNNRNDIACCSDECVKNNQKNGKANYDKQPHILAYKRITKYLKEHKKTRQLTSFKERYNKKCRQLKGKYGDNIEYKEQLIKWLLDYESKYIKRIDKI